MLNFNTHSNLTYLNIEDNELGDAGIYEITQALKQNTTLKGLHLRNNSITDKSFPYIAELISTNSAINRLNCFGTDINCINSERFSAAMKLN